MIYRRAVVSDVDRDEFRPMMGRALMADMLGPLDTVKLRASVLRTITDGYAAVAEQGGVVVAYIGGVVQEHPYFERQQLYVIGWYSESTGAGIKLFRMMMAWKDEHPMIASVYLLANPDERLNRIMVARYGAVLVPAYWIS